MRISDWSSDVCSSDLRHRTQTVDPARVAAELKVDVDYLHSTIQRKIEQYEGYRGLSCTLEPKRLPLNRWTRVAEIGRESCRERVGPSVSISCVAVSFQK